MVDIISIQHGNGWEPILRLHTSNHSLEKLVGEIIWSDGTVNIPYSHLCLNGGPGCDSEGMSDNMVTIIASGSSGAAFLIIIAVVLFVALRSAKRKSEHRKQQTINEFIADFAEITFKAESTVSIVPRSPHSSHVASRRNSSPTQSVSATSSALHNDDHSNLLKATFRNEQVFLSLLKRSHCQVDQALTAELTELRNLRHVNINPLLAITVNPSRLCIVQSFCSKGTLHQVLHKRAIQLDRLFKLSFASDIAAGMAFLHHSSVKSHGRLSSHSILVDSRWFCRIANIPMPVFEGAHEVNHEHHNHHNFQAPSHLLDKLHVAPKQGGKIRQSDSGESNEQLNVVDLWKAPELLRCENPPMRGTQRGDVYSFAIVLLEIITRRQPFEDDDTEYDGKNQFNFLSYFNINTFFL